MSNNSAVSTISTLTYHSSDFVKSIESRVDKRVWRALVVIGACWVAKEIVSKAIYGIYTNMILPKRDLRSRYNAGDWAVITGSTDGIGEAMAYELARAKFNIVLIARNEAKLQKVARKIEELGVHAKSIKFDFSNLNTLEHAKAY